LFGNIEVIIKHGKSAQHLFAARKGGEPRDNNIARQKTDDPREQIPFNCHGDALPLRFN
jgi:hypothetical protein